MADEGTRDTQAETEDPDQDERPLARPPDGEAGFVTWYTLVDKEGIEQNFTFRGRRASDARETYAESLRIKKLLLENGWTPKWSPGKTPKAELVDANAPEGDTQGDPNDPAWCTIHREWMKRREKDGDYWYSHRVGDQWCNGKAKATNDTTPSATARGPREL